LPPDLSKSRNGKSVSAFFILRTFDRRTGELNGSLSGSARFTSLLTLYGKRSIFVASDGWGHYNEPRFVYQYVSQSGAMQVMNSRELTDRAALVTGVTRRAGIGAAIARELGRAGARLFVTFFRQYDRKQV